MSIGSLFLGIKYFNSLPCMKNTCTKGINQPEMSYRPGALERRGACLICGEECKFLSHLFVGIFYYSTFRTVVTPLQIAILTVRETKISRNTK